MFVPILTLKNKCLKNRLTSNQIFTIEIIFYKRQ